MIFDSIEKKLEQLEADLTDVLIYDGDARACLQGVVTGINKMCCPLTATVISNNLNQIIIEDSTIRNDDDREFIVSVIRDRIKNTDVSRAVSLRDRRSSIQKAVLYPLFYGSIPVGYLLLESDDDDPDDNIKKIYAYFGKLISAALLICVLLERKEQFQKSDRLTLLPTRDVLVDDLKQAVASANESSSFLAVFHITNISELNKMFGESETDNIFVRVSKVLSADERVVPYRIGGAKFAVLMSADAFTSHEVVQNLMDVLYDSISDIEISAVMTAVMENPFESIYVCERTLRDVMPGGIEMVMVNLDNRTIFEEVGLGSDGLADETDPFGEEIDESVEFEIVQEEDMLLNNLSIGEKEKIIDMDCSEIVVDEEEFKEVSEKKSEIAEDTCTEEDSNYGDCEGSETGVETPCCDDQGEISSLEVFLSWL